MWSSKTDYKANSLYDFGIYHLGRGETARSEIMGVLTCDTMKTRPV